MRVVDNRGGHDYLGHPPAVGKRCVMNGDDPPPPPPPPPASSSAASAAAAVVGDNCAVVLEVAVVVENFTPP